MKVAVLGVGAIGGTYLAFLTKYGVECTGILKKGRRLEEIEIEGIWGNFKVKVKTVDEPSKLEFFPDLVIVSVKSYDTESALNEIKPYVSENTVFMMAQNGYGNYEKAVKIFGEGRVILARVIFGAEVVKWGRIRITVCADDVVIGDPSGRMKEEFLKELAELFSDAGIPTRYEKEVYKYMWDKIIYNSALNPLGALLEVNYGTLAENPHTKRIMDKIIDEIFSVLEKEGIETFWKSAEEYKEHFYKRLIPPTAEHFPSMLKDIKRGKTEIDALNGAICELARKHKLEVPTNEIITELIKAKELLFRR